MCSLTAMPDRHQYAGASSSEETKRIAEINRGSSEAFEALFRAHETLVYRVCLGFVGAPEVAEDLTQDLFLDLWSRRERFSPKTSVKAYLAGAARYKALSWIRRRRADKSLDALEDKGGEARAAQHTKREVTPRDVLLYLELQQALEHAVGELPARRRLIYRMVRKQSMSYKQVAEALGISQNTVKVQMGRTLKFLRQRLKIYKLAS